MKKKLDKKNPRIESKDAESTVPEVFSLPSNALDMENFVEKNRKSINESLLDAFQYAVRKKFGGIEVFCFDESDFVVIVNRKDFKDNIKNIFDYSFENEHFELCAKANRVMDILDKHSFVAGYKKQNKTKHV